MSHYPPELAEMFKARAGEKYQPSNGMEGAIFMDWFCDRCQRDEAYRNGTGDSCPIVANTMAYSVTDPEYPAEWQYGADGQPTCTAFEPMGAGYRCADTPDLFAEPRASANNKPQP